MSHNHNVIDTDIHYKIDGVTRTVVNVNETKRMLVQGDHNSERFTFEVPRFVDGHDLSECNFVQVNYRNEDAFQKNVSISFYDVDDLHIKDNSDDEIVVLSWLIEKEATIYEGTLNFSISFQCIVEGKVAYSWNTTTFKGIDIKPAIHNDKKIIEEYPSVIASITPYIGENGNWWVGETDTGVFAGENANGGSGVASDTFIAKYGETTIKEITDARENGKIVYAVASEGIYFPYSISGIAAIFTRQHGTSTDRLTVTESGWSRYETALISASHVDDRVVEQATHNTVPSTKAVYDFVLGDPCSLEVGFNRIHIFADTISANTFYVEKGTLAGIKEQILAGNSPKIKVRGIVTDEESHAEYAFLPSGHYYNFNDGNDYIIIEFIARFGSSLKEYTMKAIGEDIELNRFTEASSASIVSDSSVSVGTEIIDDGETVTVKFGG